MWGELSHQAQARGKPPARNGCSFPPQSCDRRTRGRRLSSPFPPHLNLGVPFPLTDAPPRPDISKERVQRCTANSSCGAAGRPGQRPRVRAPTNSLARCEGTAGGPGGEPPGWAKTHPESPSHAFYAELTEPRKMRTPQGIPVSRSLCHTFSFSCTTFARHLPSS